MYGIIIEINLAMMKDTLQVDRCEILILQRDNDGSRCG